eukprot:scaffold8804_cov115-Isochrysis_galbana.AAC.3
MPRHVLSHTRARASPPTRRTPQRLSRRAILSFLGVGGGRRRGRRNNRGGRLAFSTVRALQTRHLPAPHG